MEKQLRMLLDFHTAFLRHIEESPMVDIPDHVKEERKMLIREESKELLEAIDNGTIEEIAKEAGDVLYALLGTVVAFGLTEDFPNVFEAVHKENMSKLDENGQPIIREDGKILKSSRYQKADISSLLT